MGAIQRFHLVFALVGAIVLVGAVYSARAAVDIADAPSASYRFSFGIVPQRTATRLAESWTPLLNHLGAETGYRFDFKTARDINNFKQRAAAGAYDFAYLNPYHYVAFNKTQAYRVLVAEKDRQLTGIIVVRAESRYRTLRDLEGQSLSFPAPTAFAASLITRAHLNRDGIKYRATFVSSHDSVYLSVAQRLFAAGGGIRHTFDNLASEVRGQLRILWTSKGYTPHAIAAHPRVPPEAMRRVTAALIGLHQDAATRKLLEPLGFNGFVAASDVEYDSVRKLEPQFKELVGDE